ncbi:MAG: DUF1778 domain-containing protein [Planctomycetales bacterium]|nr:DUF1778 domain-containing protein [Planctomycetales bacterium]
MKTESGRPATRDATVNLRLQASARDLIDQAAAALGKSRTEFMVEAARREAESVLLDRCFFALGDKPFAEFAAALDQPPAENPRLRRMLTSAAPWE